METCWQRFCRYFYFDQELEFQLDISRVKFSEDFLTKMEPGIQKVYEQIKELEAGSVANPDENRMVGHYWLRNPELAPTPDIGNEIRQTVQSIKQFAYQVHNGYIRGQGGRFQNVLIIGIGGSSLGPRFVSDALWSLDDKMKLYFMDNTDPDGMDKIFAQLNKQWSVTLTVVISKSGGTVETRNGMEEVRKIYLNHGLDFTRHAVSITQAGSKLDQLRAEEGWIESFPVWEWVGGRTSVLSSPGLLPLALQGISIDLLLQGAQKCDELTRSRNTEENPSALLALMWYAITEGKGGKQMIVLPYKDRLELLAKYLQQLIMESIGKEKDLAGRVVNQGITVLGNKGSTDQHSYLQQLLDGPDNFLVTFIEVLKDRAGSSPVVAEASTSGDYLQAFFLGTRKALSEKGRNSVTVTIKEINEVSLGVLLALFERAVSMYALLINVNAYHQPAVELGKKGAAEIIRLKNQLIGLMAVNDSKEYLVEELTAELAKVYPEVDCEIVFKVLQHLAHNPESGIKLSNNNGLHSRYAFGIYQKKDKMYQFEPQALHRLKNMKGR